MLSQSGRSIRPRAWAAVVDTMPGSAIAPSRRNTDHREIPTRPRSDRQTRSIYTALAAQRHQPVVRQTSATSLIWCVTAYKVVNWAGRLICY